MKAEQLSQTAAFLAIKFYGLTRSEPYRSIFEEKTIHFYEEVVRELPAPLNLYHTLLKKRCIRSFFTFSEELLLPGDLLHVLVRKWKIEKLVEYYMQLGYKQLLVLGSGFDHLGWRFSQKGISCLELDTPKMIRIKQEFLVKYGGMNDNLKLQAGYVSEQSKERFLSPVNSLDLGLPTVIVAEGFFDYLSLKQTQQLLTEITTCFNPPTILISTVFSLGELSSFRALVYKSSIKLAREQLQLGLSLQEFAKLLKDHGFKVTRKFTTGDLKKQFTEKVKTNLPLLNGFHLLAAEK